MTTTFVCSDCYENRQEYLEPSHVKTICEAERCEIHHVQCDVRKCQICEEAANDKVMLEGK